MAPATDYKECKQCFRVVQERHYERHLQSHHHQVKSLVLNFGRQVLSACSQCKNTEIVQIRAECKTCCLTLERMYDAILKPLKPSNKPSDNNAGGTLTLPPRDQNESKFDIKFLNRALRPQKLKPSPGITEPFRKTTLNSKPLTKTSAPCSTAIQPTSKLKTSSSTAGSYSKTPQPPLRVETSYSNTESCSSTSHPPPMLKTSSSIIGSSSKTSKKHRPKLSGTTMSSSETLQLARVKISSSITESYSTATQLPTKLKTSSSITEACSNISHSPLKLKTSFATTGSSSKNLKPCLKLKTLPGTTGSSSEVIKPAPRVKNSPSIIESHSNAIQPPQKLKTSSSTTGSSSSSKDSQPTRKLKTLSRTKVSSSAVLRPGPGVKTSSRITEPHLNATQFPKLKTSPSITEACSNASQPHPKLKTLSSTTGSSSSSKALQTRPKLKTSFCTAVSSSEELQPVPKASHSNAAQPPPKLKTSSNTFDPTFSKATQSTPKLKTSSISTAYSSKVTQPLPENKTYSSTTGSSSKNTQSPSKFKTSSGTNAYSSRPPQPQPMIRTSSTTFQSCSNARQPPPKLNTLSATTGSSIFTSCSKAPKTIVTPLTTKSTNSGSSGISLFDTKTLKPHKLKRLADASGGPCSKYPRTTPEHLPLKFKTASNENILLETNINQSSENSSINSGLKVSKTTKTSRIAHNHVSEQYFAKPSDGQLLKRPHSASKVTEKTKKLSVSLSTPHSSQIPKDCRDNSGFPESAHSSQTSNGNGDSSNISVSSETGPSSNIINIRFDRHDSNLLQKECKIEHTTQSEEFKDGDLFSSRDYYNPISNNKAVEIKLETPQPSVSTTDETHPCPLTTSPSTLISVRVVESAPGFSEYTFKFSKYSPSDEPRLKDSSEDVKPDTTGIQTVTQFYQTQSTTTQNNQCHSKTSNLCEEEMNNLFPDLNSGELVKPSSPITTQDLIKTLTGAEDEVTVYDDWFLANDLESDLCDPITKTL